MRFSLRGLILATALICAVVSHVRTSLRLRETEQEATRLRNELGYLTITDANRVHAIAIGADESWAKKQWQWKLHLPEGRRFHICCMTSDLPQQGVPDYHPTLSDVQGDLKLTVSAVRDPKGEWKLVVNCDTGANLTSPIVNPAWLEQNASANWNVAGQRSTESVAPGKPLVLLRLRRAKTLTMPAGGVTVDPKPTDGILVWVLDAGRR